MLEEIRPLGLEQLADPLINIMQATCQYNIESLIFPNLPIADGPQSKPRNQSKGENYDEQKYGYQPFSHGYPKENCPTAKRLSF